jgi:hypothetical protein
MYFQQNCTLWGSSLIKILDYDKNQFPRATFQRTHPLLSNAANHLAHMKVISLWVWAVYIAVEGSELSRRRHLPYEKKKKKGWQRF